MEHWTAVLMHAHNSTTCGGVGERATAAERDRRATLLLYHIDMGHLARGENRIRTV